MSSDGKFFEKRAKSNKGRFFRDLPGRDEGDFHKAAQFAYGPGTGAAMSGVMGGSFGVGSSATGGGMYGTGTGKKKRKPARDQVSKNSVAIEDGTGSGCAKTAEPMEDPVGHGQHRPTDSQPQELEAGGGRFLQDSNGATPANAGGPLTSNIPHQKKPMKKRASDLRFMGTSFEKKAVRDPDLAGTVGRDVKRAPSSAGEAGERILRSGHRGAEQTWNWGKRTVGRAVDTVANSPALSLLALLGGGALALRGVKGGARRARALLRAGRRKPPTPKGRLTAAWHGLTGK